MSTQITATIVTADQPLDVPAGQIKVTCTGPAGTSFPEQLVPPGALVTFSLGAGVTLPPGTYIVTAQSLDTASNPVAFKGVPYPAVTDSVTVSAPQLSGPVVSSLTLQVG